MARRSPLVDPQAAAAALRGVLAAVERGEITAIRTEVDRLTGALIALEAVAGDI